MNSSPTAKLSDFLPGCKIATGSNCSEELFEWLETCEQGTLAVVHGAGLPTRGDPATTFLSRLVSLYSGRVLLLPLSGEPSDRWVDDARSELGKCKGKIRGVLSMGGGSALDAGKALAALALEPEPTIRYLERVGDLSPTGIMLPWFAIPTTAGTGSEASTNAVLSRPGHGGFKRSLRHPSYRAQGIVLDPEFLRHAPLAVLAPSAMDALTQLLESWSSKRISSALKIRESSTPERTEPSSLLLCELDSQLASAIQYTVAAMPRVLRAPSQRDPADVLNLQLGALWSGLGLTLAGLGTTHGLAGLAGALTKVPHGIACARIMGPAWRETLARLHRDAATDPVCADALLRIHALEATLPETNWSAILGWADEYEIPFLGNFGVGSAEIDAIVAGGSDRESPAKLGADIWRKILTEATG